MGHWWNLKYEYCNFCRCLINKMVVPNRLRNYKRCNQKQYEISIEHVNLRNYFEEDNGN